MKNPDPIYSEWIAPANDVHLGPEFSPLALGAAISRSAATWGGRDAVIYRHQPAIADVSWTYAELDRLASRLAAALIGLGYRPGERIAIWGPNHPEWIILEYAIAKAGLILVALNPLYKIDELKFALNDSGAAGIFYADQIGDRPSLTYVEEARRGVQTIRYAYAFSSIWNDLIANAPDGFTSTEVDPASPLMIQYTSGTTGVPKAVRISHNAITTTARNSYHIWGLGEGSRVCCGFPLFHVGGSGNSVPGSGLNGAAIFPLYIFKPSIALDILEHEKCTAFIGVPTMLIAMMDDPSVVGRSFKSCEKIIVGGAPVTRDLLERCQNVFGADVINCYGQTETCGVTSTTISSDSVEKKTQTSGAPLMGVSVAIRDNLGNSVPHNTVGQLYYNGPGQMTGYGSESDPTELKDSGTSASWIASGDLARMDADGYITIVGREKEMIIRGGENLSPVEIESYMKAHEAILDVAVIGVPDKKYGEEVCAVVCARPDSAITAAAIREWCGERISRWKVPRYVEFVDKFPLTPSGKIQKFILQKQMCERLGLDQHAAT